MVYMFSDKTMHLFASKIINHVINLDYTAEEIGKMVIEEVDRMKKEDNIA